MKKEYQVPSELSQVQKSGLELMEMLSPLNIDASALFDIRLCFEEALINAMKYGNCLDSQKPVEITVEADAERVSIALKDQGQGFKPEKLANCTEHENLLRGHGRGVHLIQQLMDRVEYNEKGNRILMVKLLKKEAGTK